MTQPVMPEVQAAVDVLRKRISLAQSEIAPLKETVQAKEQLILQWQAAIHQVLPAEEPDPYDFFNI